MRQDGSQYDRVFAWDLDAMLDALNATLDAIATATAEDAKRLRETANQQNDDLIRMHGVDLGPF